MKILALFLPLVFISLPLKSAEFQSTNISQKLLDNMENESIILTKFDIFLNKSLLRVGPRLAEVIKNNDLTLRVIKPNAPVTFDYRNNRVNVFIDSNDIIINITMG